MEIAGPRPCGPRNIPYRRQMVIYRLNFVQMQPIDISKNQSFSSSNQYFLFKLSIATINRFNYPRIQPGCINKDHRPTHDASSPEMRINFLEKISIEIYWFVFHLIENGWMIFEDVEFISKLIWRWFSGVSARYVLWCYVSSIFKSRMWKNVWRI